MLEQFQRDGYILVPGVFSTDEMDAALEAMERNFDGKSYASWLEDFERGEQGSVGDGFTTKQDEVVGRSQFPVGDPALDRLIENERYLDLFDLLLGDRPSYCNAHLFMRSGPVDERYPDESWSGYHVDHNTNCVLPPSEDAARFSYINSGVYLHDVEDDGAPMLLVPGSHTRAAEVFAEGWDTGNMASVSHVRDIRKAGLQDPVPAVGTKGTAAFYSSYLLHSAQPFQDKKKQRAFWTLSMCRRDADRFTRFSNPFIYGERKYMLPFITDTTPRVRSLFGWPEPGHPYYTEQTLGLLARAFPGIDLDPYRQALHRAS
ncbi:MAG: phytanoyl-CoA dioxygenase family protein [Gemmatimonadota bacterium]|nr:phytanoyl-CoA dioxygenase family protein [Gemmatimonadota bacterium]